MLSSEYCEFIHKSRYARWLEEEGRRESWEETVDRYLNFFDERLPIDRKTKEELREAILNTEVMPSMRAMMTAGEALERSNMASYNCSYLAVDHPRAFDETLFVLMNGTGVGFSCERQYINQLPCIPSELVKGVDNEKIVVADSKVGWAKAFKKLISGLYSGVVLDWDVSKVRGKGERLKVFGGRASGPQPLVDLFNFTIETFSKAKGRRLQSIEVHDIMCKIGDVTVVGGVRRSALISLSNLTDDRMRRAKFGQWWEDNPQRALANNSVCYTEKPDLESFMKEWLALYESKSGERGMFSRVACERQAARNGRRKPYEHFGSNPCSEIILRKNGVCNLSEIVVRQTDTKEDLLRKARLATILGTMQDTLTDFPYLRPIWKKNAEEEALLGVSMTGIMDNPLTYEGSGLPQLLEELKEECVNTNKVWAKKFGINQSAAITCVNV